MYRKLSAEDLGYMNNDVKATWKYLDACKTKQKKKKELVKEMKIDMMCRKLKI